MNRLFAALALFAACAGAWAGESGLPDERQLSRALHESASRAAVGRPGVTVCRQLLVGIAERDWIRGEVVEVQGHLIAVRIEDSGRFPHILKEVPIIEGTVIWTTPPLWAPCV